MTEIFLINMNEIEGSTSYDCVGAQFLKIDMTQYGCILSDVLSEFVFKVIKDGVVHQYYDLTTIKDSFNPIDDIYNVYIPKYEGLITYTLSYKLLETITEPKDLNTYLIIQ